jgi:septal ring factor EnvC (AmiA/AmiB activator)
MRRLLLIAASMLPLAAAQSSTAGGGAILDFARRELAAARQETTRLEAAAARASDEAARLALERQAAASAIASAEARISLAAAELGLRRSVVANANRKLQQQQRPVAELVAALVSLERRPPLLALADRTSIDQLVRTRALLGTVIPHIKDRSRSLSAELTRARQLEEQARTAQTGLAEARSELAQRQQRFADLERKALDRSAELGAAALRSEDVAVIAGEGVERIESESARKVRARQLAARLAMLPPAPPRPMATDQSKTARPLVFALPIDAPVTEGLGAVSETGIRSRGIRLAARKGAAVAMPADGTIVFAGPYRSHDGVVIIDHGDGWMTMLVGVRSNHSRETRLGAGEPLGIALGEVTVELSTNGRPVSAAWASAYSRSLSIQAKRR